jgi:hypothetical protein
MNARTLPSALQLDPVAQVTTLCSPARAQEGRGWVIPLLNSLCAFVVFLTTLNRHANLFEQLFAALLD